MENALTSHRTLAPRSARTKIWIGRVLTGLILSFLALDAIGKLIPLAVAVEGTQKVGYGVDLVRPLGAVLAASTLLHLIPRTQFLGALFLTAYLGGATATHVRIGTPFWMPVLMGALLWAAYYLRSSQFRSFVHTEAR
jgi:hypothetical protein